MRGNSYTWLLGMALVSMLLSGCAASRFLGYKCNPDYPKDETQTLDIPGLQAPVTVVMDKAGVAHIDAKNEMDLLCATGFIQARHRFFAMDMMRRMARGRISEVVGEQPFLDPTFATSSAIRCLHARLGLRSGRRGGRTKGGRTDPCLAASLRERHQPCPRIIHTFGVSPAGHQARPLDHRRHFRVGAFDRLERDPQLPSGNQPVAAGSERRP